MSDETAANTTNLQEAAIPAPNTREPSRQHPASKRSFLLLSGVVCVLIVAFSAVFFFVSTKKAASPEQQLPKKPLITIAVNPWKASELNATIAKVILQEKMGYPVKLISIDEYAQWSALAKGQIDATLEVWPSGHKKDIQKYITTEKTVENGGALGPVGKIGWYIPTYLKDEHPELATWEGLKDSRNVALFADVPGGKGMFLTGDPTWTQYDDQIIKNLGLNFEVKTLGSEDALIHAVDSAYHQKKPILFYFWTPHWAQAIYDLTPVQLPAYSDACYADMKEGVRCDYPSDKLFKAFWSGFRGYTPEAYAFLKNFTYSNQDQIGMLAAVQINKQSVDEVAHYWVNNNELTWKAWKP